jgi:integrase
VASFDYDRLDDLHDDYVDAIEQFETDKLRTVKQNTVETYLNRVTKFAEFLRDHYDGHVALSEIDEDEHCFPFKHWCDEELAKTQMRSTIITCRDLYKILERHDRFNLDPSEWALVVDSLPSSNECRDRTQSSDDVTPRDVGTALLQVRHPVYHAYFMLFFKLLVRIGEVANIKLKHVNLQDPDFQRIYRDLGVSIHEDIRHKPDTILIKGGDVPGTKRDIDTILPVDAETKTALLRALAVRPTTPASLQEGERYFFTQHSANYGLQMTTSGVDYAFRKYFVEPNEHIPAAMTPHDGRHWGGRQFRAAPDHNEVLYAYLRGDNDGDIRDHYDNLLADYENRVRSRYHKYMPSLFF